jgi:hypothetical protein
MVPQDVFDYMWLMTFSPSLCKSMSSATKLDEAHREADTLLDFNTMETFRLSTSHFQKTSQVVLDLFDSPRLQAT